MAITQWLTDRQRVLKVGTQMLEDVYPQHPFPFPFQSTIVVDKCTLHIYAWYFHLWKEAFIQ